MFKELIKVINSSLPANSYKLAVGLLCFALAMTHTFAETITAEETNDGLKSFVHKIIKLNDIRLQKKLEALIIAKIRHLEYDDISYNVEYQSPDLLSIIFTCIVTGGAHPNRSYVSFNAHITPRSVSELTLSKLFYPKSNYLKFLSDYCIADLKKQGAGFIVDNYITELRNKLDVFSITSEGLKFYFAPYEVGSYAEGSYYVTVPYKELRNLLKPNSPLRNK